ncbi:uncharacterized protein [Pempheris klunzingeri]|uniref:uncharacterized protein n=1 Tax=Pempheris klunzingeri TaxID=3127111 RepID=UPI00398064DD
MSDLQVKVIPSTEGQTVTLMCSTSCPLTGNPAAYIWYKNRQFLYQDWSPWYQQLVSSEEAATYSCAVRGYEDLRAPEVSVDSVTSSCFSVTYAKGRMCSYKQKSEDEPCTITYPTEVYVQRTVENYVTLTCATNCLLTDPQAAYRWYLNNHLHSSCESVNEMKCSSVNYVSRRICALEGASVNISCDYSDPNSRFSYQKLWNKVNGHDEEDAEEMIEAAGRVEYHDDIKKHHILALHNLMKNDSGEYKFSVHRISKSWRLSDLARVTLIVTVVTEGQRATLTCSTSCPLPHNTNYIWYLNGRPLNLQQNQKKNLVLDPVGSQHAGNYSCAVESPQNISSHERTLKVKPRGKSVMIGNAVKLTLLLLIPSAAFLLYLKMRKKKTLPSTAELNDRVQTGQADSVYESIALVATTPTPNQDHTV